VCMSSGQISNHYTTSEDIAPLPIIATVAHLTGIGYGDLVTLTLRY